MHRDDQRGGAADDGSRGRTTVRAGDRRVLDVRRKMRGLTRSSTTKFA
jgi:hypothetical protein